MKLDELNPRAIMTLQTLAAVCLLALAGWGLRLLVPRLRFSRDTGAVEMEKGKAFYSSGNYAGAVAELTKAAEKNKGNGMLFFTRGQALCKLGRYKEAVEDFSASAKLGYPETPALVWRGIVKGRIFGDWKGQYADADKASQKDPTYADAYFARMEAAKNLGNYIQALKDLKAAKGISPKDSNLFVESARLMLLLKKYAEAEKDASRAVELAPSNAGAHFVLGDARLRAGRYSEAEEAYSKAISLESKNRDYYLSRAEAREKKLDFEGAGSDLITAVNLSAEKKEVLSGDMYRAAVEYFRLNRPEVAVRILNQAVSWTPGRANLYELRGRALAELGLYGQSAADLKNAARLDPARKKNLQSLISRLEAWTIKK